MQFKMFLGLEKKIYQNKIKQILIYSIKNSTKFSRKRVKSFSNILLKKKKNFDKIRSSASLDFFNKKNLSNISFISFKSQQKLLYIKKISNLSRFLNLIFKEFVLITHLKKFLLSDKTLKPLFFTPFLLCISLHPMGSHQGSYNFYTSCQKKFKSMATISTKKNYGIQNYSTLALSSLNLRGQELPTLPLLLCSQKDVPTEFREADKVDAIEPLWVSSPSIFPLGTGVRPHRGKSGRHRAPSPLGTGKKWTAIESQRGQADSGENKIQIFIISEQQQGIEKRKKGKRQVEIFVALLGKGDGFPFEAASIIFSFFQNKKDKLNMVSLWEHQTFPQVNPYPIGVELCGKEQGLDLQSVTTGKFSSLNLQKEHKSPNRACRWSKTYFLSPQICRSEKKNVSTLWKQKANTRLTRAKQLLKSLLVFLWRQDKQWKTIRTPSSPVGTAGGLSASRNRREKSIFSLDFVPFPLFPKGDSRGSSPQGSFPRGDKRTKWTPLNPFFPERSSGTDREEADSHRAPSTVNGSPLGRTANGHRAPVFFYVDKMERNLIFNMKKKGASILRPMTNDPLITKFYWETFFKITTSFNRASKSYFWFIFDYPKGKQKTSLGLLCRTLFISKVFLHSSFFPMGIYQVSKKILNSYIFFNNFIKKNITKKKNKSKILKKYIFSNSGVINKFNRQILNWSNFSKFFYNFIFYRKFLTLIIKNSSKFFLLDFLGILIVFNEILTKKSLFVYLFFFKYFIYEFQQIINQNFYNLVKLKFIRNWILLYVNIIHFYNLILGKIYFLQKKLNILFFYYFLSHLYSYSSDLYLIKKVRFLSSTKLINFQLNFHLKKNKLYLNFFKNQKSIMFKIFKKKNFLLFKINCKQKQKMFLLKRFSLKNFFISKNSQKEIILFNSFNLNKLVYKRSLNYKSDLRFQLLYALCPYNMLMNFVEGTIKMNKKPKEGGWLFTLWNPKGVRWRPLCPTQAVPSTLYPLFSCPLWGSMAVHFVPVPEGEGARWRPLFPLWGRTPVPKGKIEGDETHRGKSGYPLGFYQLHRYGAPLGMKGLPFTVEGARWPFPKRCRISGTPAVPLRFLESDKDALNLLHIGRKTIGPSLPPRWPLPVPKGKIDPPLPLWGQPGFVPTGEKVDAIEPLLLWTFPFGKPEGNGRRDWTLRFFQREQPRTAIESPPPTEREGFHFVDVKEKIYRRKPKKLEATNSFFLEKMIKLFQIICYQHLLKKSLNFFHFNMIFFKISKKMNFFINNFFWSWAKRRHNQKSTGWVFKKYWIFVKNQPFFYLFENSKIYYLIFYK